MSKKQPELARRSHIYEYYDGIKSGKYVVGNWIARLYEYVDKGLREGAFFYNEAKANNAIDWIESHCFHTEGPLAPNPLKLEPWQKAFIALIYGIVDENGLRQFREVVLVVARKNGKSLLASAIGKYEFVVNGGYGARVFCIAPKLEQADIIYNNIWQMFLLDPEWQALKEEIESSKDMHNKKMVDDGLLARHRMTDLCIPGTNSTTKKIAFSSRKSDGFNPSLTICDEVASWIGEPGLRQYEVMKSAMGARPESMILSCTTSGYVNEGIYDELIKRSTRFLLGESEERRLLPLLYMIDDVEKWSETDELRKSNPNLNVSVSESYLVEEVAVARGSISKRHEFITKYCNIKQNSSIAWLPDEAITRCSGEQLRLDDFRNTYCVGGIDLSRTTDLTAACVVIEKDGKLNVFMKFWLPSKKIEEATARDGLPYQIYIERGLLAASGENFVDYADCYNWFVSLVEKYNIYPLQVGYDRYNALQLTQAMETYGFHMDSVYQGTNLTPIIRQAEGEIRDGSIRIGDNDLLKVHLLDSALKMDAVQDRCQLIKLRQTAHVDGTAALLDALCVRNKYWNEIGEQLKNEE